MVSFDSLAEPDSYDCENLPLGQFLAEIGVPFEAIIENIDILRGFKNPVKIPLRGESITLEGAIKEYIDNIQVGFSASTVSTRKTELYRFLNLFDKRCETENIEPVLTNILESDIASYLKLPNPHKTYKGKSVDIQNTTYNKKRAILNVLFKTLIKKSYINESPLEDVKRKDEGTLPVMFLTKKEQQQIFSKAMANKETGRRDFMIIYLALNAALRLIDIIQLRICNFDPQNNVLHIQNSKGKKNRDVYLTDEVTMVLTDYLRKHRVKAFVSFENVDEPMFLGEKGLGRNKGISREACRKMVKRVFLAAKINQGSSHRLRHTYAVNALQSGLSIIEISEQLGHASPSITFRYLRLSKEHILKKINENFPNAFISINNISDHIKTQSTSKKAIKRIEGMGYQ